MFESSNVKTQMNAGVYAHHSWDLIGTTARKKVIYKTILKNRRRKIYGLKDANPLSFEVLKTLIPELKQEEIDTLLLKRFCDL